MTEHDALHQQYEEETKRLEEKVKQLEELAKQLELRKRKAECEKQEVVREAKCGKQEVEHGKQKAGRQAARLEEQLQASGVMLLVNSQTILVLTFYAFALLEKEENVSQVVDFLCMC